MLTPKEAIVVLGYRLSDKGEVLIPHKKRLDKSVELYGERKWPLITCGWRANKLKALGKYNEAEAGQRYIRERYGLEALVESDSTSIQENLLFVRARFTSLKKIIVVTALHALKRTQYHANMVFSGNATVEYAACDDGVSDPEREIKMIGDVHHMLKNLKPFPYEAGQWWRLMLPPEGGRLRSKWNAMADEHECCPHRGHRHPDMP